jgi:hypothetical protein
VACVRTIGFDLELTSLAGDGDRAWLYELLRQPAKVGLAHLRSELENAIQSCCLDMDSAKAPSIASKNKMVQEAQRILSLIHVLQGDESAMHYHYQLLVVAAAVTTALLRTTESNWDELVAAEKVLQLTIAAQSPILQLTDLLSRPIAGHARSEYFSVRQVMRLALATFALMDPDAVAISYQETHTLQQALLSTLFSRVQVRNAIKRRC